jgi:HEAT repeat protein
VFALLQRATIEGTEHDRAFALILLGALATPKALDIVRSFLASPSLKERWASVIALGRHKEERVFPLLQTLLLDGFLVPLATCQWPWSTNGICINDGNVRSSWEPGAIRASFLS